MKHTLAFKKIGVAILAMAALTLVSASAAIPSATINGTVSTGPSVYTGGSIYYQFNLMPNLTGPLVVKATLTPTAVKGVAKWKPVVFQTSVVSHI